MGGWGCQDWLGRALPSAAVPVAGEVSGSRAGASGVRIPGGGSSHRKISGNKNSYSYIEVRRGRGNYSHSSRRTGRRSGTGSAGFPETRPPRGVVFRAAGPALSGLKIIRQGGPLTRSGTVRYRRAVGSGPFAPPRAAAARATSSLAHNQPPHPQPQLEPVHGFDINHVAPAPWRGSQSGARGLARCAPNLRAATPGLQVPSSARPRAMFDEHTSRLTA